MSDAMPRRSVLRGIVLLARFRPEAFGEFNYTAQGFLSSLSPLIAFGLIGVVQSGTRFGLQAALVNLCVAVITMLAPTVITHALAARWGRQDAWIVFAVAFNWAQVIFPAILIAAGVLAFATRGLGVDAAALLTVTLLALLAYALALHWFIARSSLRTSRRQTLLCMVVLYVGVMLLLFVPLLMAALLA